MAKNREKEALNRVLNIALQAYEGAVQREGSMASSARVAMEDAIACDELKDYKYGINRALVSIAYSESKFSGKYKEALLIKEKLYGIEV